MKPIKKEDMPKLILLIVLAVGIFGFALVQMMSLSSPSVAATPAGTPEAKTVVASAGGATPLQDPSALESAPHPELDFLKIGPPTGGKDPFATNGAAAPAPITSAIVPAPPIVQPLPPPIPEPAKSDRLKNLMKSFVGNGNGALEITESTPQPAPIELPVPTWGVSGIVLAERDSDGIKRGRDVAILRDGAGNRRFVTVGDPVDNGFQVSAVRINGVEIRSKNRTALIRLDSSTSNSSERPGAVTGTRN